MMFDDRILVVDDVPAMRQLLRTVLIHQDYDQVTLAASGEEALEQMRRKRFAVVMLDIELPGMSGLDVLQQLRAIDPGVFVVMVSAHHSAENVKEAIARGVNGFIVKPYQKKKVAEVLKKYRDRLQQRSALAEIDW